MSGRSALAALLAEIVGNLFVSDDPTMCAEFAVHRVLPACVVAPGTFEQLAAVMATAHAAGAVVVPWGGGTQQLIGGPPEQVDLVVRTGRLNRVLIHEPDDLTISVEAGMTLGALHRHLAAHNQMLPINPPLPEATTIGGLLATAMDGPRRLGYGTLRDLLIGIGVVDVAGRATKAGGMVVKNVSGFDMMKLYHGSFGTLAVIASANFKLLPMPRAMAALLCCFPTREDVFGTLADLHASQLTPSAAEYLNSAALRQLSLEGAHAVYLLAEGLPQAVKRHVSEFIAIVHAHRGQIEQVGEDNALGQRVADLPQTLRVAPDEAVVKIVTLPGELAAALDMLETLAPGAAVSARALDGVAYARLGGTNAAQLVALAARQWGLQWIATPIADAPRWGALPEGAALMRRIKLEFDPSGQLNPGRFAV